MKNPLTQAGIEPATFRFVAQHLNHCAAAVPHTLTGTDTKAHQGPNTKIRTNHHKQTSNRRRLRPNRGKYEVQDNLVHTAITGHDVTHRYKEEHNDQKGQIGLPTDVWFHLEDHV